MAVFQKQGSGLHKQDCSYGALLLKGLPLAIVFQNLVGEDGFEPPKTKSADLQSAPFGHSGIPPYFSVYIIKRTVVQNFAPLDETTTPFCGGLALFGR